MMVRIGEIRIKFKCIPQNLARESLEGIGEEIMNFFAQQYSPGGFVGFHTYNIEAIDAGTVECRENACPDEIRSIVARRIAGLVEAKIR